MSRLIVALDVPSAEEAVTLAETLVPHVGGFKIGLGLLTGPGPHVIDALVGLDRPVFADAKLHDIPSQVATAATRLGAHGARWVSAHAAGGGDMLEAAVAGLARGAGAAAAGVLAITVLTSLDAEDLSSIGVGTTPGKLVSKMARLAEASGCEGAVCSPRELGVVVEVAPRLIKVTPGIRPPDRANDDQVRTATGPEAIQRGADFIVVGRPITNAGDPPTAAAQIAAEIAAVE